MARTRSPSSQTKRLLAARLSQRAPWQHGYDLSEQTGLRWIIESMFFAIRERTTYELGKASVNISPSKTALVLIAAAGCAVAGVYAVQKPYQQERIKFALHRFLPGS